MKKLLFGIIVLLLSGLLFTGCLDNSCNCGTIEEKTPVNQNDGSITWALKINWDCDKKTSIRNVDQDGGPYFVGDYICF